MDFTMQNATLEDLNELSLLMNQAHKTMEHPEWFATDDDVYLKKHLEKHGCADRVDHRSLKEQGIEREPEKHLGPKFVSSMTVEQASAILERRVLERELLRENNARDSIIDLSTDVRSAIAEKDKSTNIEQEMRAGIDAFKNAFEAKKAFMSGFEAFKKEQEIAREKEVKKSSQRNISRGGRGLDSALAVYDRGRKIVRNDGCR